MHFPALANRGGDQKQDKEDVTKRNSGNIFTLE